MMECEKVEQIISNSIEGIEYSVNNISNIITIPLIGLLIYLSIKSALVFSIVVGIITTEVIICIVSRNEVLSVTEILIMVLTKFYVDIPLDIVLQKSSRSVESSMVLCKSYDGEDRAIIYISDLNDSHKLRILYNIKIVYHMYVYMSIILLATNDNIGYEEASGDIIISKLHAIVRTLIFTPRLYSNNN